jgi:hypothetical protein
MSQWVELVSPEKRLERAELCLAFKRWQALAPGRDDTILMTRYTRLLKQRSHYDISPNSEEEREELELVEREIAAMRVDISGVQSRSALFWELRPRDPEAVRQTFFQTEVLKALRAVARVKLEDPKIKQGNPHQPLVAAVAVGQQRWTVLITFYADAVSEEMLPAEPDARSRCVALVSSAGDVGILAAIAMCDATMARARRENPTADCEKLAELAPAQPLPEGLVQRDRPVGLRWVATEDPRQAGSKLLAL